jgi:hypothetical protein
MLLEEKDINVVESLVAALATIGGDKPLAALRDLASRDRSYLQKHYEQEIFQRVANPRYWDLPSPDRRRTQFEQTLARAIERLERAEQASAAKGSPNDALQPAR